MIEVKDLSVSYRQGKDVVKVLERVKLKIQPGEVVVLIGPSGCGKSTLLNVLGGIIKQQGGEVYLNGECIDYRKNAIGYVPQGYGLLPWKSVYKNCVLPYGIKGIRLDKEKKVHIDEVMEALGISALRNRYPVALSGGQRQRVALARAFAFEPELLLMDEPFSALDAIMKDEAIEMFLRLWRRYQCMSVVVTHSIEEALYMGTKIVVMSQNPGRIVSVLENPLFGISEFREDSRFRELYHELKEAIRGGRGSET